METPSNPPVIVADSSFLYALVYEGDANHQLARRAFEASPSDLSPIHVPEAVLSETVNIVGKKLGHQLGVVAGRLLLEHPNFVIVDATDATRWHALHTFEQAPASVSYTDCLVMATADEYQTRLILGFDVVFGKHGYLLPQVPQTA